MYLDFRRMNDTEKNLLKKAILDLGLGGTTNLIPIPFSTEIPLDGNYLMEGIRVNGPLTFSPKGKRIAGATCYVRLVSDGVNTPVFAGMGSNSITTGWSNGPEAVNFITFYCDGVQVLYHNSTCITQSVKAAVTTTLINPQQHNQLIATYDNPLSPTPIPDPDDFSVTYQGTPIVVTNISINSNMLAITLAHDIPPGDPVYVTYTPTEDKPLTDGLGYGINSLIDKAFAFI